MEVQDGSVLVALADERAARSLEERLGAAGHAASIVTSAAEALAAMETELFNAALVSVVLRTGKPAELLIRRLTERWPDVPVIGLLEEQDAGAVLTAMHAGATDAIDRRASSEDLGRIIERALAVAGAGDQGPTPPAAMDRTLIGDSPLMAGVREQISRASAGTATVLVRGESGTGKELVARALHRQSSRVDRPFVKVNCAGLPETLLESELFGHEKGAFTGAVQSKPGRVEAAQDGTLFLDEIGDVTPLMQVKLLRLLQDREYERLGSNEVRKTGARFVMATHRDLEKMVSDGDFRGDLFYRINVVPIWVPPLRARRGDVSVLARSFFETFRRANEREDLVLEPGAVEALARQRWPGNVRELQNIIERMVVMSAGAPITALTVEQELRERTHFSSQSRTSGDPAAKTHAGGAPKFESHVIPLDDELHAAERKALLRALDRTGGSRAKAARLLGIGRTTLYRKLEEHGLV